ncbi:MAG: hypothetical protein ABSB15_29240 [Bryobacteraceae bacterium]|jgi:hypothetical protein
MNPLWWVVWSGICSVGTGLLVYFIMQSRMEVLLSKQREDLAAARAALAAQKDALQDSLRNATESSRRQAMDDFLADIRIEERHYTREQKMLFPTKKSLVRQERIFFRNIPLSNWVEQEMPIQEGADIDKLVETMSVFAGAALLGETPEPVRRLLR